MNVANSNQIREEVLWQTELRQLPRWHLVMHQTHLCSQLSVLLTFHETKAIGYWIADAVTTLLVHETASLCIRQFQKETTPSEWPTTPRSMRLEEADIALGVWDAGEKCKKTLILHNILHVPDYGRNSLLSMSQLRKSNMFVDFHHT